MDQFLQEAGHTKEAFTERYMRQKLIHHFGDSIIITTVKGKSNVVTFKSSADRILRQSYEGKGGGVEEEKQRIIKAAAKLILLDIKAIDTSNNDYPSCDDIANESFNLGYLPSSLRLFMDTLLYRKKYNLKKASIGQALIQAARPTVLLSPLQVGLGVEVHHLFGSRYLVDHLNKLGFSVSYTEVKRFEQNAALANTSDIKEITPSSCVQFIADNVDHNIRTLDGNGTFHGMGIIASVTPAYRESTAVARQEIVMAEAISEAGKIHIKFYTSTNTELRLVYKPLRKSTLISPAIDLIWKMSWPLRSPRPGWSGMMQSACDGSYPGQSKFTFLPMIDLDPTNMSCIYSTLQFVSDLAVKHNILPIVTFDQPLWWKAKLITSAEPENSQLKSIVLKLGGFHTQMSFLGSIGHIMEGFGLQELLEMVFAKNSVTHMLSGHSVARAVRGHLLVDRVLNAVLGSLVFNYSLEDVIERENAEKSIDKDLATVLSLYDQVINKALSPQDVERCSEMQKLSTKLEKLKEELSVSRTATLWLQYMDMVDILRHFIRAERTGDWLSHLQVLNEMLPYVAAAGHNLYTKSIYIYLQDMQNLEEKQREVFHQFIQGHHVLRRSDRYWAGLSADLAIEQLLMRSIKSVGGLTRGRGMSDSLRTQWILAMPACADINRSMQEVTGMEFITSNQHKDTTKARQDRDCKDMFSLLQTVLQNNPFVTFDPSLRNICTGVVAGASVNVDLAKKVGEGIVMGMAEKNVVEFKFKKKQQAKSFGSRCSVEIDDDNVEVDPQLLFQRLITAATSSQVDDIESMFKYELSSTPAFLFDASGLMRESAKSKLKDAFQPPGETVGQNLDLNEVIYVLDGCSVLHRHPWRRGDTFGQICSMYVDHLIKSYRKPIVIFDGYETGPSTKGPTHLRRSVGIGSEVRGLREITKLTTRKDIFLSNVRNKQAFIRMLGDALESKGIRVLHATGDADTLIVKTALRCAENSTTHVIGEDTDLLVLLSYHVKPTDKPVFFCSDKRNYKTQKVWHIQKLQESLKPEAVKALPFIHAVNGCDTTSHRYGIGKSVPLKKMKYPTFAAASTSFCTTDQSPQKIISDGEKALVSLYNGQDGDTLDKLRYQRFCEKVASSISTVQVQSLPPTSAAAKFHSLRVYLQVQEWIHLSQCLDPKPWGWQLNSSDRLEPILTDLPPAPDCLLRYTRCKCKTDCRSRLCTCRKYGLECSKACKECKGLGCTNSPHIDTDVDLLDIDNPLE